MVQANKIQDSAAWIETIIADFIAGSPENSLKMKVDEPAWSEAVVGFSIGSDPLFESFKEHVGPFHFTPVEIFNATFPQTPADSGELTVISWVLPQRKETSVGNRTQSFYPDERWLRARVFGEQFNALLRKHLVARLAEQGMQALAPQLSPLWKQEVSPQYGLASRWSERHAAYAGGLGTFGLSDGLITVRGKAHRVGSVVARLEIPPTVRAYRDHHEYCLFYQDGSCMACAQRCPVNAISEKGHDKERCLKHVFVTCAQYSKEHFGIEGYACGLCQTAIPCEHRVPVRQRKDQ